MLNVDQICSLVPEKKTNKTNIYVRLTTGPVPPNRPIPTTGPIPTNGPIFPTTGQTFIRHLHKWADRNVKRDVSPCQCDEDHGTSYHHHYIPIW